jgi:hypothetical protein
MDLMIADKTSTTRMSDTTFGERASQLSILDGIGAAAAAATGNPNQAGCDPPHTDPLVTF